MAVTQGVPARSAPAVPPRRPRPAPPSPAVDSFALAGRSERPDPARHAYRDDLADIALAGRVIASHYAEPLIRHLVKPAPLMAGREADAAMLCELPAGEVLHMLDCSLGWAWGYAGKDRLVGYVRQDAVAP